ncbi:MAG: SusE domain-containing protein [Bacteroidota bacterium]|nr:SusE domain-containing protein [Bacteroidota bacterium]
MKKWLTPILAVAFAGAALTSCKKDETKVTLEPSNTSVLSASTTSVTLVQANGAQNVLTYNWTPTNSFAWSNSEGTAAPVVSYQLQFAKTADGFGYPGVIDAGVGTTKTITVQDLNSVLYGLGLAPAVPTPVYVRLATVIGNDVNPDRHTFVSNVVSLTATVYKECLPPNSDTWALVGPAGKGWPSGSAITEAGIQLIWDCDAKAYMARTALTAGDFKFRQNQAWSVNLGGLTKPLVPGAAPTPLKANGEDMTVAVAGTYTVKLVVDGSGATVTGGTLTITP